MVFHTRVSVTVVVLKSGQRLRAVGGLVGFVARVRQPCGNHVPYAPVVIDNENASGMEGRRRHGVS